MNEKEKWKENAYTGRRPLPWLYPDAGNAALYGYPANAWKLWNDLYRMPSYTVNPYGVNSGRTESEMDMQRLQELYPVMARRLQPYVEEIVGHLEYSGSMMYDEYPDRLSLLYYAKKVWEAARKEEDFGEQEPKWEEIQDLVMVLLLQEMLRRRQKKRERISHGMMY